jgi:hypothetical protein
MGQATIIAQNIAAAPVVIPAPAPPAGTLNGTNAVFTLASPNLLMLVLNGVVQNPGSGSPLSGADYTISGVTVTFTVPPLASDWMLAFYN